MDWQSVVDKVNDTYSKAQDIYYGWKYNGTKWAIENPFEADFPLDYIEVLNGQVIWRMKEPPDMVIPYFPLFMVNECVKSGAWKKYLTK